MYFFTRATNYFYHEGEACLSTWFLISIYLAFISLGLPDSLLGSAWPVIWPEIGSSLGSAGIVSMIIAGGTIVSSLFSKRMVERLGTGRITLFSCFLTAVALLGFFIAPSMLWFIVFALLTLMFLSTETINRLLIKPTQGRG